MLHGLLDGLLRRRGGHGKHDGKRQQHAGDQAILRPGKSLQIIGGGFATYEKASLQLCDFDE